MAGSEKEALSLDETLAALRATLDYIDETARLEIEVIKTRDSAGAALPGNGAEKALSEGGDANKTVRRRERDIIRKLLIFKPLKKKWDRRKRRRKSAALARYLDECIAVNLNFASLNAGFYGNRALTNTERYTPYSPDTAAHAAAEQAYAALGARIVDAYGLSAASPGLAALRQAAPCADIRAAFEAAKPNEASLKDVGAEGGPVYSILTSFFEQEAFFPLCAKSVEALIQSDAAGRIEWVLVNDDPRLDVAALEALMPETVRPFVRIFSDGRSKGIVARLNEAAAAARGRWLLQLGCEDEIEAKATAVLDHYIAGFPRARYISSSMADIDEGGKVLRFRRQEADPTTLFESGMIAGSLVAVRRDLFAELGGFRDAFPGCQDYDFALRAAIREPLLVLPEYLYRYRWRVRSRPSRPAPSQDRMAVFVLRAFLDRFASLRRKSPAVASPRRGPIGTGRCIIRTQGRRIELLAETLESLRWQSVPVQPIIVVHGDAAAQDKVRVDLAALGLDPLILGAARTDLKRGHPMNVAMDYLRFSAPKDDYFFFLDDDDIVFPFFAERLTKMLDLTGADVAVGLANRREPWRATTPGHQLLPVSALLAGNFIPIHCYLTRVGTLRGSGLRCREDMDYLEDWDLLIGLLGSGARFHLTSDVLCEYRIFGDGNTRVKRDPAHYQECTTRVKARAELVAKRLGVAKYAQDLAEFDFSARAELTGPEIEQLTEARAMFETKLSG